MNIRKWLLIIISGMAIAALAGCTAVVKPAPTEVTGGAVRTESSRTYTSTTEVPPPVPAETYQQSAHSYSSTVNGPTGETVERKEEKSYSAY